MKAKTGDSFMMSLTRHTSQAENKFRRPASYFSIFGSACSIISGWPVNRERGRKGGKEEREPVGMPKDFDFHMPVIDVMFKLTHWVASTTTAANFE